MKLPLLFAFVLLAGGPTTVDPCASSAQAAAPCCKCARPGRPAEIAASPLTGYARRAQAAPVTAKLALCSHSTRHAARYSIG